MADTGAVTRTLHTTLFIVTTAVVCTEIVVIDILHVFGLI